MLRNFVLRSISSEQDAEELTADILLKTWTMGMKLSVIDNLTVYLFKAAKNKIIDYYRKIRIDVESIDNLLETEKELIDRQSMSKIFYDEMDEVVINSIEKLPPKCRMVFLLVRESGLTHEEVGNALEISKNTIESHMRMALRTIKKDLTMYLAEGN